MSSILKELALQTAIQQEIIDREMRVNFDPLLDCPEIQDIVLSTKRFEIFGLESIDPFITKVLEVAKGEIGVREVGENTGPRVREYQSTTTLSGTGWSWCAAYVAWVLKTAIKNSNSSFSLTDIWLPSASCDFVLYWARRNNILFNTPQIGDSFLVMATENDATHIGLVKDVLNNEFKTYEGNAQPLTSNILTKNGWIKMGEVKEGYSLIDPYGEESFVEAIYPQGEKDIYRLTISDGSFVECTLDHLWNVRIKGKKDYSVVSTEIIYKEVLAGRSPQLPQIVRPDLGNNLKLPIDPYVLGLLIGDGGLNRPGAVKFSTKDIELLNSIQEVYPELHIKNISIKGLPSCDYRLTYNHKNSINYRNTHYLKQELNNLGLCCKSEMKFIPNEYLFTTVDNRIALLQGLLDSDGHADLKGRLEFSTVSLNLAKNMIELIQSLGGKARLQIKENNYYTSPTQLTPKKAKIAYRLAIRLPEDIKPFRLKRKQERVTNRLRYTKGLPRYIRAIEKIGKGECQCIKVSAKSSMYITDNFVPTHNTNNNKSREGIGVFSLTRPRTNRYRYVRWPKLLNDLNDVKQKTVYKVYLGDKFVEDAFIEDGTSWVSAQAWAKAIGFELGWNQLTQTVTFDKQIVPKQVKLINGRAYLPVRYLAERNGLKISFDTQKIIISKS